MPKKNPQAEEQIIDVESVVWEPDKKHHVQVRLEDGGPRKKDGRRGQIVLEDPEASDTIARWLMSPKCRKAEKGPGGRRQAYVWIDGSLMSNTSEDIPDADSETTALAPVGPSVETEAARQYLAHLYSEIRLAEKDLTETRQRCQAEIEAATKYRDGEIAVANAQLEVIRARLTAELEREQNEMEALANRRKALSDQMEEDDRIFGLVRSSHGRRLLAEPKSTLQEVTEFVQKPAGAVAALGIAKRLGVDEETAERVLALFAPNKGE